MLKINRFDHQGRGIGILNNKIIFIKNALPDEIVEYEIIKNKKNYLEGKIIKIIKQSNKRIKPICPYYNICGGCQLMHIDYEQQLKFKQEKIENIIHKYTENYIQINNIIKCDNIYNYRNKATIHVDKIVGFFQDNTNKIINVNYCYLLDSTINNILKELSNKKYEKDEIIIRSNGNDTLIYHNNKKNNLSNINADNIILKDEIIKGNNYIIENLNKYKFLVSPTSFFQVNTKQTIKLYDIIKQLANLNKNDYVLDLYCGTGTIGIYLSEYCNKVLGVEINKYAIKDANENKKINNIKNIDFIVGDAKDVIKKTNFKPTVIIVDPPRSGLFKGMINDLIKFNAEKIIYVSCEPITLARDLKELKNFYDIKTIQPIDMFPNTYHVECVSLLYLKETKKNLKNNK